MPTLCPRCRHTNDDDAHQCEKCGEKLAELCDGPKPMGLSRPWPDRSARPGVSPAPAHSPALALSPSSSHAAAPSPFSTHASLHTSPAVPPFPVAAVVRWSIAIVAGLAVFAGLLAGSAFLITDYGDELLLAAQTTGFVAGAVAALTIATLAALATAGTTGALVESFALGRERRRLVRAAASAHTPDDSPAAISRARARFKPSAPSPAPTPYIERRDSTAVTVISAIALVFAFMGVCYAFIPLLGVFALFTAVPAAGLAIAALVIAQSQRAKLTLPTVALVLSLIGTAVAMLQVLAATAAMNSAAEGVNAAGRGLEKSLERTTNDLKQAIPPPPGSGAFQTAPRAQRGER